uniref:Uncharacterized protein n=1 Tax=Setaria italica TaxID=4555 RepID=K4API0_SETIT
MISAAFDFLYGSVILFTRSASDCVFTLHQ